MILVVHYWRLNTDRPWRPGGVAVFGAKTLATRYIDVQDAAPAHASLQAGVAMIELAYELPGFTSIEETVVRLARSGFSGHLYQWLVLEVPDEYSLATLYRHYVTEGRVALLPGASPLEVSTPFG